MEEKSELTDLFRSRLSEARMSVREGFWEQLNESMCKYANEPMISKGVNWHMKRVAAAAAVGLLVLGAASAAFWYFSPEEEIKEAFTQADRLVVDERQWHTDDTDVSSAKPYSPVTTSFDDTDDEALSVHVSITITEHVAGGGYTADGGYQPTSDSRTDVSTERTEALPALQPKPCNWALKTGVGSSLPKGECDMPFTVGVTVERRLGNRFSLETGLRYNCLSGRRTLHTLEVPLRANLLLAVAPKIDVYALAGGAVEKCVAGTDDNGFGAEPVQWSVVAGLGVRYKLNERFALFAEPTVSHHFDTDSRTKSLRTERPTNFNLLCGLRMTY